MEEILNRRYIYFNTQDISNYNKESILCFDKNKHYTLHSLPEIKVTNDPLVRRYMGYNKPLSKKEDIIKELGIEGINKLLKEDNKFLYRRNISTPRRISDTVYHIFSLNGFGAKSTGINKIFFGNGTIADKDLNFKAALCIKKEYIKYFKLWLLVGGELDFDIFYVLIDKEFNSSKTSNKTLKSIYNKAFKPIIKEYGLEIIEVNSLNNELFITIQKPKVNTISEYKNWLNEIKTNAVLTWK